MPDAKAGQGSACKIDDDDEFKRHGLFNVLALRVLQAQFVQSMQSAVCNAHHD
jgi:hypothetical protein